VSRLPLFAVLAGLPAALATVLSARLDVPVVGPAVGVELGEFVRDRAAVIAVIAAVNMLAGFVASVFTTRLALAGIDGDERRFGPLAAEAARRLPAFVGWSLVTTILTVLGFVAAVIPGLVAVVFFSFVDFAVVDATSNPLRTSIRAVYMVGGDVVVVLLVGWVVLVILGLGSGLLARSLPDPVAAFTTSLAAGLFFAYLNCALGALYRATPIGANRGA